MSLTQEQIENLSQNLSKIKIDDEKLGKDVNGILKYIDLLNEVDTTWVEPTVSVVQKENTLREDVEKEKTTQPKKLLDCSKQKVVANQIAISNIMK